MIFLWTIQLYNSFELSSSYQYHYRLLFLPYRPPVVFESLVLDGRFGISSDDSHHLVEDWSSLRAAAKGKVQMR